MCARGRPPEDKRSGDYARRPKPLVGFSTRRQRTDFAGPPIARVARREKLTSEDFDGAVQAQALETSIIARPTPSFLMCATGTLAWEQRRSV